MATGSLHAVLDHLRAIGNARVNDAQLLQHYIDTEDEAAFAAVVRRHGRLVLGVCRRILGYGPDAEDAFQATFVVLARKARSIRKRSSLASWLHGVARRVAVHARGQRTRRQGIVEDLTDAVQFAEDKTMGADPVDRASLRELATTLDEELERLPAGCRDAVVVCLIGGRSHTEAAKQLGWSLGTLKSRVARGRELLQKRLQRRGIGLGSTALSASLVQQAQAYVPAALLQSTIRSAAHKTMSPAVAALAKAGLATLSTKFKVSVAVLLLAGITLAGVGLSADGHTKCADSPEPKKAATVATIPQKDAKPTERVDALGDPLPEGVVARLGTLRFKHSPDRDSLVQAANSLLTER